MSYELLCRAILDEDLQGVKNLLAAGADVNTSDKNGLTPLMQAAEIENIQIAALLLANGADISAHGYHGVTALHLAVDVAIEGVVQVGGTPGQEPLDFVEFLLAHGAEPRRPNVAGASALDWAKSRKSNKLVELLGAAVTLEQREKK